MKPGPTTGPDDARQAAERLAKRYPVPVSEIEPLAAETNADLVFVERLINRFLEHRCSGRDFMPGARDELQQLLDDEITAHVATFGDKSLEESPQEED